MNYNITDKHDRPKVRRGWGAMSPMTRVKNSIKRYNRNAEKKNWKSNLDYYCN